MKIIAIHRKYGQHIYNNIRLIQIHKRDNFFKSDIILYSGNDINNLKLHCLNSQEFISIDYVSTIKNILRHVLT